MTPRARVVVIDSGIDVHHPGVRGRGVLRLGPAFADDGSSQIDGGGIDHLGHGTAVAAAILAQCASVELIAVRVFDASADCAFDRVLHALRWAIAQPVDFINVSLGTTSRKFEPALLALVEAAQRQRIRIIAPACREGMPVLPGMLLGVEAVVPDANVPPSLPTRREVDGRAYWFAAPTSLGRPTRVEGVSLATANVTGYLAGRMCLTHSSCK